MTTAWHGDESYEFRPDKCRFFLALTRPLGDPDRTRAALQDLVLRPGGYLHFYEEQRPRRLQLAWAIGSLGFERVVVTCAGDLTVAQARVRCLKTAARTLAGRAPELVLESTGLQPDDRDSRMMSRLYPPEHRIPVRFVSKRTEPLIWPPDIVAGAAFQAFVRGNDEYLNALGWARFIDSP